jgi:O-antigen/teichoic acid export membrane protein
LQRNFAWNFSSSALILAIGVATGTVAARTLGPEARGELGIVVFWGQFLASFATLSLTDALVLRSREAASIEALTARGYVLAFWLLAITVPLGGLTVYLVTQKHGGLVALTAVIFGAVQIAVACIDAVAIGRLRADHRFTALDLIRLGMPAAYLLLIPLGMALQGGVIGFVIAHTTASLLALGARLWSTKAWRIAAVAPARDTQLLGAAWGCYQSFVVATLAAQADRLLLVQWATPEQIGLYLVAATLAGPVQGFLATAIKTLALPALMKADAPMRPAAALRLLRLTFATSLIGALGTALVAPFIVPLLFGHEFAEAGSLTSLLTLAISLAPVRAALTEAFKAESDFRRPLIGELTFLGAFVLAFAIATLAALEWAVIWGLAGGNLVATLYQGQAYANRHPGAPISGWAVPTLETGRDLMSSARRLAW